jgi:biopolymer transport protein ExbB/TolQ
LSKLYSNDLVYQVTTLVLSFLVVHVPYTLVVRPRAQVVLETQARQMRTNPDYVQERSWWVIIKDPEQEWEFILCLWALSIMGAKWHGSSRERKLLESDLVPLAPGARILPEDAREYARQVQALPEDEQRLLLPRTALAALNRFRATRSIQDAASTAREVCGSESDRLDSELAMIRYIAWAIPSIGFIGTVRGIGDALTQAHRAVQGDISGVTEALGVAFNSTFVALLLSLLLMFVLHQLQLRQERQVLDTESYVHERVLANLSA